MTDVDEIFNSTKNQLIALEALVGVHLLVSFIFGIISSRVPNSYTLVNRSWSVVSLIVIVLSLLLASNIYVKIIKDSPDKKLRDIFISIIALLALHALVSVISLGFAFGSSRSITLGYVLSISVLITVGILLIVLNTNNDIMSQMT